MLPGEVTPRLHSHFALAGLHRNSGRNQIGMLAGFTPERCPESRRNGGRFGSEYAHFNKQLMNHSRAGLVAHI